MPDDDHGSVTRWNSNLRDGNDSAPQRLWERYFARMVELARAGLRSLGRRDAAGDEEDTALSAFDSFCAGVARGRFPELADRKDLDGVVWPPSSHRDPTIEPTPLPCPPCAALRPAESVNLRLVPEPGLLAVKLPPVLLGLRQAVGPQVFDFEGQPLVIERLAARDQTLQGPDRPQKKE
jgi:hypothetical protein